MAQLASAHAWPAVVTTLAGKGTLIIKNNGDWRSWLARMHGVHEAARSSRVTPTKILLCKKDWCYEFGNNLFGSRLALSVI